MESGELDWCGVMRGIERDPDAMMPITARQLLRFRQHVLTCQACKAARDRVNGKHDRARPTIGPKPEAN